MTRLKYVAGYNSHFNVKCILFGTYCITLIAILTVIHVLVVLSQWFRLSSNETSLYCTYTLILYIVTFYQYQE